MSKYKANNDIVVNGNVISAGNTFVATAQDVQGLVESGLVELVSAESKTVPTAAKSKTKRRK